KHPWTVTAAGDAQATLSLDIAADLEPYSYHATQAFVLSEEGLGVTMTLTNTGPVSMPFGFGLHPWFDRDPDVTLQFKA
ncbi:MAG: aldose 1-epimerase, partial [Mesorhizobium sp.]